MNVVFARCSKQRQSEGFVMMGQMMGAFLDMVIDWLERMRNMMGM
ncbi:hypothetical protein [Nocardia stercoris]|nr:hypothetical protein [Nocardia stercoris]